MGFEPLISDIKNYYFTTTARKQNDVSKIPENLPKLQGCFFWVCCNTRTDPE